METFWVIVACIVMYCVCGFLVYQFIEDMFYFEGKSHAFDRCVEFLAASFWPFAVPVAAVLFIIRVFYTIYACCKTIYKETIGAKSNKQG